jgi:drug/metabolite transporter (DMT)-like permease
MVMLSAVCFSGTGTLIRLTHGAAWTIVFWRAAFQVITLILWLAWSYRRRLAGLARRIGWVEVSSGLLMGLVLTLWVTALKHTTVASALVIQGTAPIFAALFARLTLREPIGLRIGLAIAAAFVGMIVMFGGDLHKGRMIGDLLALLVAIAVGMNIVIVRYSNWVDKDIILCVLISGASAALAASYVAWQAPADLHDIGLCFVMGTAQMAGFILFTRGASLVPAAETGLATPLETILGILWVWLAIGEAPSVNALIGGGVIVTVLVANATIRLSSPSANMRSGTSAPAR